MDHRRNHPCRRRLPLTDDERTSEHMSVTGIRGAEWRIEMKTRILTDRWRKMLRRRRRMHDPYWCSMWRSSTSTTDGIAFSLNSKFTKTARDKGPHLRRSMK